ncbi:hypothetical protein [Enterococcus sp.]|uniref:hypothetical protein n=1 Tax=Enterococcus sp. TaxID=35783 RepID=UPI003C785DC3
MRNCPSRLFLTNPDATLANNTSHQVINGGLDLKVNIRKIAGFCQQFVGEGII